MIKGINLTELVEVVREAFGKTFRVANSDQPQPWVREVHTDAVIVRVYENDVSIMMRVPYSVNTEGQIEFADRTKWQPGRYVFVASEQKTVSGFKTVVGADGQLRWVGWSSSAYRDLDVNPWTKKGEIVTLGALKLWAEYAHKTGEYGELWWAHDEAKAIGVCDASLVQGAFLIETGTFNDTPQGKKAAAWLAAYDGKAYGPLGMSIGYEYDFVDRFDGIYEAVLIKERSVLPLAMAANRYTQFQPNV